MKYLIVSLFIILLFIHNESLSLWEQDEAAYAGFAYNMLETGNYILPDFEWSWPHRKPPLHFWLIAGSYYLFGYNEFATRVPSVLAIISSLGLIYFFVKKHYGKRLARWTAMVFMSSLLIPVYGKISMTDATLLLCFIGSYFSILSYLTDTSKIWLVSLFVFTSLGGLTKGPPIFIVTFGALGIVFLFSNKRKLVLTTLAIAIAGLIPLAIWAYGTYKIDGGEFFKWWLDWYILKRASGTIYGQTGFIGYYLIVFTICFLPWILFLPTAVKWMFRDVLRKNQPIESWFNLGWIIFGWLIYEILRSKLPSYAFAVLPIWCIYIARSIVAYRSNQLKIARGFPKLLGFVLSTIGVAILILKSELPFENLETTSYILASFLCFIGILYIFQNSLVFLKNKLPELALIFAFGINFIAWAIAIPAFEPTRNFPKRIAQRLLALNNHPKYVFFSADYSMSSLPVYLSWGGYRYSTANKRDYEKFTADSLRHSRNNLFMIQRRNFRDLHTIPDSFKISPTYGWISDRGVVDTFFIAERMDSKHPPSLP